MSLHFFLWMENSHIFEMMYHMSCEKDQNIGFDISQEASALSTYAKKVDAMCVTRSVGPAHDVHTVEHPGCRMERFLQINL